ncbi:hypothetical protein [Novosphingobium terrae]|uniref:hypothetical protein n=1 Tax=Novosphingobium terrae TaxID=2726189 RepID=UPI00197FE8A2|nr:hypothetical protein [Novosphingobium terrae]
MRLAAITKRLTARICPLPEVPALAAAFAFAMFANDVNSQTTIEQRQSAPALIGPLYPVEDFGIHSFVASPEQVRQGEQSLIADPVQKALWTGLITLVRSQQGYHSPKEISQALGVKLVLIHSAINDKDVSEWDGNLHEAHIMVLEGGPNSAVSTQKNSPESTVIVSWMHGSMRPYCISSLKMFSQLQAAGGTGYQQVDQTRVFRFPFNEQVSFSSAGISDQLCVSKFSLIGHANHKGEPP